MYEENPVTVVCYSVYYYKILLAFSHSLSTSLIAVGARLGFEDLPTHNVTNLKKFHDVKFQQNLCYYYE